MAAGELDHDGAIGFHHTFRKPFILTEIERILGKGVSAEVTYQGPECLPLTGCDNKISKGYAIVTAGISRGVRDFDSQI